MIVRSIHSNNYTIIDNQLINDGRLSLEQKGLLVYLLSKPDNWVFSHGSIRKDLSLGKNKLNKLTHELQELGYLRIEKHKPDKNHNGKFWYSWAVLEIQDTPTQDLENHQVDGIQDIEKGSHNKTIINNNIINNSQDTQKQDFENGDIELNVNDGVAIVKASRIEELEYSYPNTDIRKCLNSLNEWLLKKKATNSCGFNSNTILDYVDRWVCENQERNKKPVHVDGIQVL